MLLLLISFIIILLMIILYLPLYIVITIKNNNIYLFNIKIKIFNKIVIYKHSIPIENVINNTSINKSKNNDNKRGRVKKDIIKVIEEKVKNLEEVLKRVYCTYEDVVPIIKYFQHKFKITNLKWITQIGLDDAAITAVTTGVLWNIKMQLYIILVRYLLVEDFNIDIKPIYNKKVLDIDFYCIIRLKIVYIIIAGLKVKLLKRKGCASNVRTSN